MEAVVTTGAIQDVQSSSKIVTTSQPDTTVKKTEE